MKKTLTHKQENIIAAEIIAPRGKYTCGSLRKERAADIGRTLRAAGYRATTRSLVEAAEEVVALRDERRARRATLPHIPTARRLSMRLIKICNEQIAARNLSTPAGWWSAGPRVIDRDKQRRLWLVAAEYKYHYSNRFGDWWTGAAYLCGRDDGQYFAVRVPRTIDNIDDALEWITPAPIRQAREKGLPTRRQGDIFFRPMRIKEHDMAAIEWTRHTARPRKDGGLTIVHPEHRPLRLSGKYKWRAYQSTQVDGNSRSSAD